VLITFHIFKHLEITKIIPRYSEFDMTSAQQVFRTVSAQQVCPTLSPGVGPAAVTWISRTLGMEGKHDWKEKCETTAMANKLSCQTMPNMVHVDCKINSSSCTMLYHALPCTKILVTSEARSLSPRELSRKTMSAASAPSARLAF
jgi:hypothetical protein